MPLDLYSSAYFNQKTTERLARMKPEEFEPWDSARERYIDKKIEPLLQMYRQSDHDSFKDFARRRGVAMHHSDLIFRIQKLNPRIFVQQQVNFLDDWGLYADNLGRVQFLTGVNKGWSTEFSWAVVDDKDLPMEERRGWRTVLVYAMLKGALAWEDVVREFGEPQDGWNETRWCEATAELRHGGEEIQHRNVENALET